MITLDYPRDNDVHTIADFGELICLFSDDGICSRESIDDRASDSVENVEIPDEVLSDCFDHFSWRAAAFGERYPFSVDSGLRLLTLREEINADQLRYIVLLLCANLPFLPRTKYKTLTEHFEKISKVALGTFWFSAGGVRSFGKNQTEFSGTKAERLNQLAQLIGARGLANDAQFRRGDIGDGGIDLAAWAEMDNYERRNIPSALAQCACSRSEWPRKQSEISLDSLQNKIAPTHPWMQVLFSPVCYRNNAGEWAYGEVSRTIFFDRLRIINALPSNFDSQDLATPAEIEEILSSKIDRWQ